MAAVVDGQRPNIEDIQGPEHFAVFMRTCIEKCWNGEQEQRPTFAGEISDSVFSVITSDKVFLPLFVCLCVCLFVCLPVSKITQKCLHGFGLNVAHREMSGHGRTD